MRETEHCAARARVFTGIFQGSSDMSESSSADTLADLLIEARRNFERVGTDAVEALAIDEASAYHVQKRVAEVFGPVGAYKTGRKSANDAPNAAPIFASHLRPSGSTFRDSELCSCGIELEIAFRIDRALPALGPDFEMELRQCVSPLAAFELVDGRIEGFLDMPSGVKLADNQNNGGFIFGEPVSEWDPGDLGKPVITLRIGGATVLEGPQPVPGGNAYDNLVAFLRAVDTHGYTPKVGDYVTTGSLSGMPFVEAPCVFEGRIEGLGEVRGEYQPAD
jgi:2-keto-4-pentenoate hydratase